MIWPALCLHPGGEGLGGELVFKTVMLQLKVPRASVS